MSAHPHLVNKHAGQVGNPWSLAGQSLGTSPQCALVFGFHVSAHCGPGSIDHPAVTHGSQVCCCRITVVQALLSKVLHRRPCHSHYQPHTRGTPPAELERYLVFVLAAVCGDHESSSAGERSIMGHRRLKAFIIRDV